MLKDGMAGALKIQLSDSELETVTELARVLSAARPKGDVVVSPNAVLLRYAMRGIEAWAAEDRAAAEAVISEKLASGSAVTAKTKEEKEANEAAVAAQKAQEKAQAAQAAAEEKLAKAQALLAAKAKALAPKVMASEPVADDDADDDDGEGVEQGELKSELVA